MNRDPKAFPNDENGNALWEISKKGISIGEERDVRFAIIFPTPNEALKFGVFLLQQSYWVQVNEIDDRPGFSGEVLVDIFLETTHQEISGAEAWLAEHSSSIGGKTDGWSFRDKPTNVVRSEFQPIAS